jgi:hypothetical protein
MVDVGKLWRDLILDIPDVGRCPRWPHLEPKPQLPPDLDMEKIRVAFSELARILKLFIKEEEKK